MFKKLVLFCSILISSIGLKAGPEPTSCWCAFYFCIIKPFWSYRVRRGARPDDLIRYGSSERNQPSLIATRRDYLNS